MHCLIGGLDLQRMKEREADVRIEAMVIKAHRLRTLHHSVYCMTEVLENESN